ncbi:MAG: dihydrolipoyl dehydrogenase [Thermaerobacter sp.]|nr:dihydrolipoyl dehydrogenase [Thermaerobacter sp.]
MAESFDLVVLGGGLAGYVAAIRAAQLGMKTALVERDKMGGTCLHRGCIPTKALLHTADVVNQLHEVGELGIKLKEDAFSLDYPAAMKRKGKIVTQLWRGVEFLMKKHHITVYKGTGRLASATQVVVDGEKGQETLAGKDVLVAVGSEPRPLPNLPFDGQRVLSSDHVLERDSVPASVLIVGGGAIGVEFASMYRDFGSEVTLVEMLPHILPQDDAEVAAELTRLLTRRGMTIHAGAAVDDIQVGPKSVSAKIKPKAGAAVAVEAEVLLVAIGRQAVTAGIGLEALGIKMNRGFVEVDDAYRTNVPHVLAAGDCIGGYLLAHVATHEGMIAVEALAGDHPEGLSPERVPRVTYCRPEVASVGVTQEEAEAAGHQVKTGTFPFRANGKALILQEGDGFVKLVADAETDALLGAHVIGPHASDLINEMALAKFLEGTAWEVGESVHAHPTVSETLHEAALVLQGHGIHV